MNDETRQQLLAENLRFYGDMRFKQLTLFVALLSLCVAGVGQYGGVKLIGVILVKEVISIAAMVFTAVLWVMEVRSTLYFVAHKENGNNLWPSPPNVSLNWLNATNCVFVLYLSVFCFWAVCAYYWTNNIVVSVTSITLGFTLLLFTILNYRYLWRDK